MDYFLYSLLVFNILALLLSSINALALSLVIREKAKLVALLLSLFLWYRYIMFSSYHYKNMGIAMEFMGSTSLLVLASLVHSNTIIRLTREYKLLSMIIETILTIIAIVLLFTDSIIYHNITLWASISYIILLLPIIYYLYKNDIPLTNYFLYLIFDLLASSDIRELVILFDIDWWFHKYRLLLYEQFLIWLTAISILFLWRQVKVHWRMFIIGVIVLALGNLLQIPPLWNFANTHNPHHIMELLIRITPLPIIYSLEPRSVDGYD